MNDLIAAEAETAYIVDCLRETVDYVNTDEEMNEIHGMLDRLEDWRPCRDFPDWMEEETCELIRNSYIHGIQTEYNAPSQRYHITVERSVNTEDVL